MTSGNENNHDEPDIVLSGDDGILPPPIQPPNVTAHVPVAYAVPAPQVDQEGQQATAAAPVSKTASVPANDSPQVEQIALPDGSLAVQVTRETHLSDGSREITVQHFRIPASESSSFSGRDSSSGAGIVPPTTYLTREERHAIPAGGTYVPEDRWADVLSASTAADTAPSPPTPPPQQHNESTAHTPSFLRFNSPLSPRCQASTRNCCCCMTCCVCILLFVIPLAIFIAGTAASSHAASDNFPSSDPVPFPNGPYPSPAVFPPLSPSNPHFPTSLPTFFPDSSSSSLPTAAQIESPSWKSSSYYGDNGEDTDNFSILSQQGTSASLERPGDDDHNVAKAVE